MTGHELAATGACIWSRRLVVVFMRKFSCCCIHDCLAGLPERLRLWLLRSPAKRFQKMASPKKHPQFVSSPFHQLPLSPPKCMCLRPAPPRLPPPRPSSGALPNASKNGSSQSAPKELEPFLYWEPGATICGFSRPQFMASHSSVFSFPPTILSSPQRMCLHPTPPRPSPPRPFSAALTHPSPPAPIVAPSHPSSRHAASPPRVRRGVGSAASSPHRHMAPLSPRRATPAQAPPSHLVVTRRSCSSRA